MRQKLFNSTKLSLWSIIRLAYWPICSCFASKQVKKEKSINDTGEAKLQKALNTRTLIKLERSFATMQRLEYGKSARQMLYLQRRQTVLETKKLAKSDQSSSEDKNFNQSDDELAKLTKLQSMRHFFDKKEKQLAKGIILRNGIAQAQDKELEENLQIQEFDNTIRQDGITQQNNSNLD